MDNIQPIAEKGEKEESERSDSQQITKSKIPRKDSEDDLGRSGEQIDLKEVEVASKGKRTPSKPILSKEEVEKVKQASQKNELQVDVRTKQGFKELLRF